MVKKESDDSLLIEYGFRCTGVFVVQSLPNDERQTGRELYDDIIKRQSERVNFQSHYTEIHDKSDFNAKMEGIVDAVINKRHFPVLHFEIHGSAKGDGFVLASGELVTWPEFAVYTRKINVYLRNELVISLSTCHGAQLYRSVDFKKPAPFWGFVAPKRAMGDRDLLEAYTKFYDNFLFAKDLAPAVDTLDLFAPNSPFAVISAELMFHQLQELADRHPPSYPTLTRRQRRAAMCNPNHPLSGKLFWETQRRKFLML